SVLDADLHVTAGAAEPTRRLVPAHAIVGGRPTIAASRLRGGLVALRELSGSGRRGGHRGRLDEVATLHHDSASEKSIETTSTRTTPSSSASASHKAAPCAVDS